MSANKNIITYFTILFNIMIFIFALHTINEADLDKEPPLCRSHSTPYESQKPHLTLPERIETEVHRSSLEWDRYIEHFSAVYGVDPDMVRAIIHTESRGNPKAISHDGAKGLMQLMPITAKFMGVKNALNPVENIHGGVKYISWIRENYGEEDELWHWNAGGVNVKRGILPRETVMFIEKVRTAEKILKGTS